MRVDQVQIVSQNDPALNQEMQPSGYWVVFDQEGERSPVFQSQDGRFFATRPQVKIGESGQYMDVYDSIQPVRIEKPEFTKREGFDW